MPMSSPLETLVLWNLVPFANYNWVNNIICCERKVDFALGPFPFIVAREPDNESPARLFVDCKDAVSVWSRLFNPKCGMG